MLRTPYPTDIAPTYLLISHAQYKVFLLSHVISPLSIIGSLIIIYRIFRFDRREIGASNRRTYLRLVVVMSICDVFGSTALAFGGLPVPKTTLLDGAWGNTATCSAQGFFVQVFVNAVFYYNAGLMFYFVVTIRYGWSESKAAKWLEPAIHFLALVVPFTEGVVGLFLEIFNPIGFGNFCYISPYPPLCGVFDACTRGQSAAYLYTYFSTIPQSILLAVVYISLVLIYCSVRDQGRRALAISANRDVIQARTKSVAVQSMLFAVIFFNTYIYGLLSPLVAKTAKPGPKTVKWLYILGVLTQIFLPLQGFLNLLVFIRPRFMRLWRDEGRSIWVAVKLAAFGGPETSSLRRVNSKYNRGGSSRLETQSAHLSSMQAASIMVMELEGGPLSTATTPKIAELHHDESNSEPNTSNPMKA